MAKKILTFIVPTVIFMIIGLVIVFLLFGEDILWFATKCCIFGLICGTLYVIFGLDDDDNDDDDDRYTKKTTS